MGAHFPLAVTRFIRNLFIMRQMLLALALFAAVISPVWAANTPPLTTHSVTVGEQGTLQIAVPQDWTFMQTNVPGAAVYAMLRSPTNSIAFEMWVYWDGFARTNSKPTETDFAQIVSNTCLHGVFKASTETEIKLEKFQGPAVSGTFARFTEAHWVPMVQGDFPNIATGMFRSGNLWGNFNLLTYGKDGPQFKQGLEILKSIRRKP